jgi:lysophospholipase L1-like esterase
MADAPGQATMAVSQHSQYVTIEMGANDLCTSSPDTMTSTSSFEEDFRSTLKILIAQNPQPSYVFVASIPDIYQLWQVLHTNSLARLVWATAHICQSMLGATRTEAERQLVVDREAAFNDILAKVCAEYARCLWDGGAVYAYKFSVSQVSTLDYFHPSLSGQATLARVTWAKSWWGSA